PAWTEAATNIPTPLVLPNPGRSTAVIDAKTHIRKCRNLRDCHLRTGIPASAGSARASAGKGLPPLRPQLHIAQTDGAPPSSTWSVSGRPRPVTSPESLSGRRYQKVKFEALQHVGLILLHCTNFP